MTENIRQEIEVFDTRILPDVLFVGQRARGPRQSGKDQPVFLCLITFSRVNSSRSFSSRASAISLESCM